MADDLLLHSTLGICVTCACTCACVCGAYFSDLWVSSMSVLLRCVFLHVFCLFYVTCAAFSVSVFSLRFLGLNAAFLFVVISVNSQILLVLGQ